MAHAALLSAWLPVNTDSAYSGCVAWRPNGTMSPECKHDVPSDCVPLNYPGIICMLLQNVERFLAEICKHNWPLRNWYWLSDYLNCIFAISFHWQSCSLFVVVSKWLNNRNCHTFDLFNDKTETGKTAFDRRRTNCISLIHDLNLDLQSPTHMQKFKVNSQSVRKIEWKQMDGWMDAIALHPSLMQSVIIVLSFLR